MSCLTMFDRCLRQLGRTAVMLGLAMAALGAHALTQEQARALSVGDNDERILALGQAVERRDAGLSLFLQALLDGEVMSTPDQVLRVRSDQVTDAASGAALPALPEGAEEVINSNQMRRAIEAALAAVNLFSEEASERRQAIDAMHGGMDAEMLPMIDKALAAETDDALKALLEQLRAEVWITSELQANRLAAAKTLATSLTPATRALVQDRLRPADEGGEADVAVRSQLKMALRAIESRLAWGERLGVLFTGVSLGSILLLVALGLAITYGLMGVINMAHGELMMIGAYATYVVQDLFRTHFPNQFAAYVLVAIPVSFLAAALVGAVMERLVIRWLYGRPLETLLATWGISLVLMQAVRSIFGAQNVSVENPSWLSGGVQAMSNLTLPYNRIAIIVFAVLVLVGVSLVIARTRMGLFVRGVTQNRKMASCVGVDTARIDTCAFALGSGIAGLAGCALSQLGNVGPDLGQGYIVDAFMVVVLGGVGQLAGTVYAALGLGVLNKLLEGWQGAVMAKIMVLAFIVVFIQKRPQGIFAMKGRSAEA